MPDIDFATWESLVTEPSWYTGIVPELEQVYKLRESDSEEYENLKEQVYDFFEAQLKLGTIALAKTGPDHDAERLPIDIIILHHTSNPPGLSPGRLSAIELARLYAPEYYQQYKRSGEAKPVYSGHFRQGRQIFWPYHWMIRQDGTAERLLNDEEIGWQAGDWDINCRSVAICFDGDFEKSTPSEAELASAREVIKTYYGNVTQDRILGHCEVNKDTVCPSQLFLGKTGWKHRLLTN
jgi:hypothetical protein